MDRSDERQNDRPEEPNRDDAVGQEPEEPTRRRRRDSEGFTGSREIQQTPGATGIDMGAGGSGTDVDRDI